MTTTPEMNAIAKERRLKDLQVAEARYKGRLEAIESRRFELDTQINQAQSDYIRAQGERVAVEEELGTVITDGFGPYSSIDTMLRRERFAGKEASVDYIKANPECAEADAELAWEKAGKLATGFASLLVPAASYSMLYRLNLVAAGLIAEATYEAQRAWIVATPKETVMGA